MRNATRSLGLLFVSFTVLLGVVAPAAAEDGIGVVDERTGEWYLRDPTSGETTSFYYGNPGDRPFVGDWDCDGTETPGLYRQRDGYVYLRNSNTQGYAHLKFFFGNPGDVPLAGDWNGDGCDTVSLYRPSEGRFYVINTLGSEDAGLGAAELSYTFGNPGDTPFAGDFDGDGVDTFGVARNGRVYLSNTHGGASAATEFDFGDRADPLLAGAWTAGGDTIASYRSAAGVFALKHSNSAGIADTEVLTSLTPEMAIDLLTYMFSPIDLLFYGIAIYEGYRFAFRQFTHVELAELAEEKPSESPPDVKMP